MKKSAFLMCAALTAFVPFSGRAEAPINDPSAPVQLSLGGYMNWYGTYANNKNDMFRTGGALAGQDYNRVDVMGDAEIYFKGETLLDNGVKVGVMAQIEGGTDDAYQDRMWDEVYMYVQSNLGQLLIGDFKNVSNRMTVYAPTASGVLGAEETYLTRMTLNPGVAFIDSTYSKIDYLAPKLGYISPTVGGLTFAFSGTTANNTRGHDASVLYTPGNPANDGHDLKYAAIGLVRFDKEFEEGSTVSEINASAYFGAHKPNVPALSHAEREFGVGLKVSFGGLSIGSSYRRILADSESFYSYFQGYAVDTGIMYTYKKWAFSANYYLSRARGDLNVDGDDKVDLYLASARYRLGAGVDTFIDVGYMTMKDDTGDDAKGNKGIGTAVGFALSF